MKERVSILKGGPITEGVLAKGAFYRPTLLEVSDPKLPIATLKYLLNLKKADISRAGLDV